MTWTTDPRHPTPLPTRLLGTPTNIPRLLQRAESGYIASRESAARIAVDAFRAHPLFGIGWDRFPAYASTRSGVGPIATHDQYLQFAAELGLPGLIAILLLSLSAGWAAVDERAGRFGPTLIGVLVAGAIDLAFGNLLASPNVILPAGTAAAIAVALSARRHSSREPRHA